MHDALIDFTRSLPVWLQWGAVMLISAIPFVESHFGAMIGVLAGVPAPIAIVAAVVGNALSVLGFILAADAGRRKVLERRAAGGAESTEPSRRRQRVRRVFDRFGVPGVGLVGQMIVPNQITAGMMVSFGARRTAVIVWQLVGIVIWAVAFGLLAQAGLAIVR